jgi:hypothetical protein
MLCEKRQPRLLERLKTVRVRSSEMTCLKVMRKKEREKEEVGTKTI